MQPPFSCPICQHALTLTERTYACVNNHQFDLSRQGYVNLLPANRKKSKNPGDSAEMIEARRSFLAAGFYDFVVDEVVDALCEFGAEPGTILDMGCGEGFFLNQTIQQLPEFIGVGTDISKAAIKQAARHKTRQFWAVAGSFHLPIADASCSAVLRMFAPGTDAEISRVLRSDGLFITLRPGPDHLFSLKELVYPEPRRHPQKEEVIEGLKLICETQLQVEETIHEPAQLRDLLQMTPYYWHGSPELKQQLDGLTELTTTFDFVLSVYRKA